MPKPRCVETLGDALIRARTVEANNLSSKYWNTCVVPTSATPPIHALEVARHIEWCLPVSR